VNVPVIARMHCICVHVRELLGDEGDAFVLIRIITCVRSTTGDASVCVTSVMRLCVLCSPMGQLCE
jgi:hypothetical protein